MARRGSTQPTEVELEILAILWELGESPVREIHSRLAAAKGTNYSTTVKMLSVMLEKGQVTRDEEERPHVYRACVSKSKTQQNMLDHVIQKLFGGSAMSLVMQALSSRRTKPEEIEEIRHLLDSHFPSRKLEPGKSDQT